VKKKTLIIKENIRVVLFSIIIISFTSIFLFSCQSSETNRWTPPKFVKEWEIKEIKPGLQTHIISMTANQNGVYVLVKGLEVKYLPPKITKEVNEMTEKEKENFIQQYVMGRLFSASAISKMTKQEKEAVIEFITRHFRSLRNVSEMKDQEKEIIIEFLLRLEQNKEPETNKNTFKGIIEKEGKDRFLNRITENIRTAVREETQYFSIQHYDSQGNLIGQWPEENKLNLPLGIRDRIKPILIPRSFPYKETIHIDSRDYLIEPTKILSDESGHIYLADYSGNKIVKFDPMGKSLGLWKMFPDRKIVESFTFHGITVGRENHLLLLGEGEWLITPKLYECDSDGKLLRSEELKSKIKVYYQLLKGLISPLMKIERVADMSADKEGNMYLLRFRNIADEPTIIKLTPEWKEERTFDVILKEGFESSKIKEYDMLFKKFGIKKFNSTQMSWIDTEPGFYFPSSLFTVENSIYITLLGSKPFGVIDALIYDANGKMVGYWKQKHRSHMDWYKDLDPNIEVVDTSLSLAQFGSAMFMGRTMKIRTGAFYTKSVIQRFQK